MGVAIGSGVQGWLHRRARWRPRLRTLLLLSNLVVLTLPLGGILLLRLYESALVRQTESELVAQAAVLAGAWRAARGIEDRPGLTDPVLDRVRRAGLDLARDPVLRPAPDPAPATRPPLPEAAEAGRRLTPVLRDAQAVTLAAMRVLDADGTVVATTGSDLGRSAVALEEVERARHGEPSSVLRRREKPADPVPGGISRTSWIRVFTALPVMDGDRVDAVVLLSRTPRTLVQAISGKRPEIVAVGAVMLMLVAALAAAASRLISQPLAAVVAQARRVAAGGSVAAAEDGRRTPLGTREVAELSDAIARMAETLERRAAYVRSLAAHVSHEFKTPLAGIRGAAELLEDHAETMTPAERAGFVAAIQSGTARLDRLVRGLLDLARADMTRAAGTPTPVRPVLERVAARYPALPLTITGEATAAMPEDALEGLFAALLGNVQDHAGPRTAVRVLLAQEDRSATIRFADDGPGISAANASRVFDPFFTTAREGGGTGLGLAIAHALVAGAGGTIGIAEVEKGAAFGIRVPG